MKFTQKQKEHIKKAISTVYDDMAKRPDPNYWISLRDGFFNAIELAKKEIDKL